MVNSRPHENDMHKNVLKNRIPNKIKQMDLSVLFYIFLHQCYKLNVLWHINVLAYLFMYKADLTKFLKFNLN